MNRVGIPFGGNASHAGRLFGGLLVAAIVAGFSYFVIAEARHRMLLTERTRALTPVWQVAGPPCPELPGPAFARSHFTVNKTVELWEVRIDYRFGDAGCLMVSPDLFEWHDYPVCRFSNPEVLRVTTDKGERYFSFGAAPGAPRPATVSVKGGEVTCVAGAGPEAPPVYNPYLGTK